MSLTKNKVLVLFLIMNLHDTQRVLLSLYFPSQYIFELIISDYFVLAALVKLFNLRIASQSSHDCCVNVLKCQG